MGFKTNFGFLAILLVFLKQPVASAENILDQIFSPSVKKSADIKMSCNYGEQTKKDHPDWPAKCKPCMDTVLKWKDELKDVAQKAQVQDSALSGAGTNVANGVVSKLGSSENASFKSTSNVGDAGKNTNSARSSNAQSAADKMKACSKEIQEACGGKKAPPSLPTEDTNNAQAMQKACDDAAAGAGQFAEQKKKDGDSLGDMSKLMDAASKAMGAAGQLAQAMQGQQGQGTSSPTDPSTLGSGGATAPTPNSSGASETSGTAGSGTGVQSPTVGFGLPSGSNGMGASSPGNGGGGSNSAGSGSGASSAYRDLASGSSSPFGSTGSGGSTGASGGGSGMGGSSGSANGTGASRPGEGTGAADASAANNYEVSGGGGRAIVGLKPSKGDMDAVTDGATTPPAVDAAKLDDLGVKPSDENAAADDVLSHDGESIFLRVRQKYSLLKGAGRI